MRRRSKAVATRPSCHIHRPRFSKKKKERNPTLSLSQPRRPSSTSSSFFPFFPSKKLLHQAIEKWGTWGQIAPGVDNGQSEIKLTKLEFSRPAAVAAQYQPDEGFTGLVQVRKDEREKERK